VATFNAVEIEMPDEFANINPKSIPPGYKRELVFLPKNPFPNILPLALILPEAVKCPLLLKNKDPVILNRHFFVPLI